MKEIKMLVENIGDELDDARKYAKLAMKYKSEDPDMANLLYKLAGEEMGHMNALHQCVENHIESYKRSHGEPPESMTAVYDYLHEKQIEKAQEVKNLLAMYREM